MSRWRAHGDATSRPERPRDARTLRAQRACLAIVGARPMRNRAGSPAWRGAGRLDPISQPGVVCPHATQRRDIRLGSVWSTRKCPPFIVHQRWRRPCALRAAQPESAATDTGGCACTLRRRRRRTVALCMVQTPARPLCKLRTGPHAVTLTARRRWQRMPVGHPFRKIGEISPMRGSSGVTHATHSSRPVGTVQIRNSGSSCSR